jgi:tetratricopeptide (TPR) repeat protein
MTRCLFVLAILVVNVGQAFSHHCAGTAREIKPDLSASARQVYVKKLSEARTAYAANPSDAEAIIWLGRRTAYLGEYKAAIRIFTDGIAKFPNDARLYRHRGHRLITLRCFDDAITDLKKAGSCLKVGYDEVEPDGLPNAKNVPTSTLAVEYSLSFRTCYYLKGDWSRAPQHL